MQRMNSRTVTAAGALASVLVLGGCGGGGKGADSPGTCPDGTTLKGSDCVPSDSPGDDSSSSSSSSTSSSSSSTSSGTSSGSSASAGGGDDSSSATASGKPPYDKDAVDIELKRAVRQVKANCGTVTDDTGQATGPWGQTTAHIVLGRNGHVKQVTVPAPYDGKVVGLCVVHAFQKIQFPPYNGSSDAAVDLDIEIVQPKK